VTVIFAYFQFSVIAFVVVVANSLFDRCNNRKKNYAKPEMGENNCHFYLR
jgi:hypothetical protein